MDSDAQSSNDQVWVSPVPERRLSDVDVREQMYRHRGAAVTIGSQTEWAIRHLASSFAGFTHSKVTLCWGELKSVLRERGLTAELQRELQDVTLALKARNKAAHLAYFLISAGGGEWEIVRFRFDGGGIFDRPSLKDLEQEAKVVRDGYGAVKGIGHVLDADDQEPLAEVGMLRRMLLTDPLPPDEPR